MKKYTFLPLAMAAAATAAMAAEEITLTINAFAEIRAEVAATPMARRLGLSQRKEALAADAGMLFVFEASQKACMWMKDTHIPLAAAFLDANGRVHAVARMRPHSRRTHCADNTAYVLEAAPALLDGVLTVGAEIAGLSAAGMRK